MATWTTPTAVHSKCGESTFDPATGAKDDDTGTYWRHDATCYHWIIFDLGETYAVSKIRLYQSSTAGQRWGKTDGLDVFVSDNPADFGSAVWSGALDAAEWQESGAFSKSGRYVKLVSKSNSLDQRMNEFDAYCTAIVPKTSSDTGVGAEASGSLSATNTQSDIGSGADAAVSGSPFGTFSKSETGAGVDALSVRLAFLLKADTGTGADALTELLASLVLTDSGAGTDLLIEVYKAIQKFSTDWGTGIDLRTELLGVLSQLDSGSGTESLESRLLDSSDQGAGRESGKDTYEASYGSVNGVCITHNFNLSDYIALITSIADPDASVGEVHINSIESNAFTIYNSGRAKSKFRWWIPIDPCGKGDSTFAGLGGRTLTHAKGDTNYVPCVIPSALGGGAIGEWWITDIANTSFVVRNSGSATTTFSWAIPRYDTGCKGASTFAGEAGITITHNLDVHEDYIVLIVPTENPNGHLGAVYVTDATANSFKVKNTGVGTTSFLWIIFRVRTFSLLAALLRSDTGTGIDVLINIFKCIGKLSSDTGVGSDALTELSAILSQSDLGAGADAISELMGILSRHDSGSGIESIQSRLIGSFDQGAGTETLSELLASLIQSDIGVGVDEAVKIAVVFILLKLYQESKINIAVSQEVL